MFCLILSLPPPPSPPPPSARCQLEAQGMSSNLGLSPWRHHSHCAFRPQVGVIDEELAFWMCVSVTYYDIWHLTALLKNWRILYANDTFLISVLCAPLEISPSSLQFYVEHLALQSHDYTQVSVYLFLFLCLKKCLLLHHDSTNRHKTKGKIERKIYKITYCI